MPSCSDANGARTPRAGYSETGVSTRKRKPRTSRGRSQVGGGGAGVGGVLQGMGQEDEETLRKKYPCLITDGGFGEKLPEGGHL